MGAVHYRTVQALGHPVFYREAGDPALPTVLLLHGAPTSSFMFRDLIPLLADRYHVVAPDLVGFGLSDCPAADEFDYTFDNLTDVVEAFLAEVGVRELSMYVQDYGAPVGWRLLMRDPSRVTAIVSQNGNAYEEGLVESFWAPLWRYAAEGTEENAAPLRESLTVDSIRWQYTHGVTDVSLVSPDGWLHDSAQVNRPGNPDVQLALYADYPSNVALYPAVQETFRAAQVPLLAVWGENDEIFGPDGARAFKRDLATAQIELLDGGHFLLETHLHEVAALMLGFLGRNTDPAVSA